ncbi:MAG: response regulator transcription factor [Deltaproteobacteria bacterium]|nr:response regulator transcription factor [Deltaproteobacteria bacterium]MBW2137204.1 response regulator transcription factor [Deltaproteobacteria bacterium]
MIRILIADDHAIVREGLKQIISDDPEMVVSAEASTGSQALDRLSKGAYDVVILDVSMPGGSGLEVLKQIRRTWPELPVIILTMYPEEHYAIRALKAGASGYLTKENAPEELVAAIKKAAQGGKYVSASLAEKLASYLEADTRKPLHERLSDREYEVMCMIGRGRTSTQIARELNLSVKTISTYRSRILEKMGMENNAEIIRYAVKNCLVD